MRVGEIPLKAGGFAYNVDEGLNPWCTHLMPSGVYKNGTLLRGTGGSLDKTATSLGLNKLMCSVARKVFLRTKGPWIGPDAAKFFMDGGVASMYEPKPYPWQIIPASILPANLDKDLARIARSRERILAMPPADPAGPMGVGLRTDYYRVVRRPPRRDPRQEGPNPLDEIVAEFGGD